MAADYINIVLPPIGGLALLILSLLLYSIGTQPAWWQHAFFCHKRKQSQKVSNADDTTGPDTVFYIKTTDKNGKPKLASTRESPGQFLTWEDNQVVEQFLRYQNAPHHILCLAMPTILSLAFCPLTLFLYPPMAVFFWPDGPMPNVNDAIASFLTPAGLVYAIAFGFAFQEAQNRQTTVEHVFNSLENCMKEVLLLVNTSTMVWEDRQQIRYFIKQETMTLIHMITQNDYQKHAIWTDREGRYERLLMMVQDHSSKSDARMDHNLQKRLVDRLFVLYSNMMDSQNIVVPTMKILHWIFLECLGFFAFFGILLVQAGSPRLQLVMCMLTVFSISMFCYILADLDQPHHGVFRVNLRILVTFLHQIRRDWVNADPDQIHNMAAP